MATEEATTASFGPHFAPDDPTLPQPWKGLVDGCSGILYYWNPETNATQYEKPSAPPPVIVEKQAPVTVPRNDQSLNGTISQQNAQQLLQAGQQYQHPQQGHRIIQQQGQLLQQPIQQMPMQQLGQHTPLQHPQQISYQQSQQMPQQYQPMPLPQQMPYQHFSYIQGSQGGQFSYRQGQPPQVAQMMTYQHTQQVQGPPVTNQQHPQESAVITQQSQHQWQSQAPHAQIASHQPVSQALQQQGQQIQGHCPVEQQRQQQHGSQVRFPTVEQDTHPETRLPGRMMPSPQQSSLGFSVYHQPGFVSHFNSHPGRGQLSQPPHPLGAPIFNEPTTQCFTSSVAENGSRIRI